jgi:RNA polymerase sigma-70 factor (ECF subfamily)
MAEGNTTAQLALWLARLQDGDAEARDRLVQIACERLRQLAHRMLRRYPHLQRWEQTDDVLQNAALRLYRSLQEIRPTTVAEFFGLAAAQVRRTLVDLVRHHYGRDVSRPQPVTRQGAEDDRLEAAPAAGDSGSLESWVAFHEQVQALPAEEREIVDLLFYAGRSQAEAAEILGVSERTVKRRWQSARIALHEALRGQWPER